MDTNTRRIKTTEDGMCRHCMSQPAKPGLKHCEKCLQWFRNRRVERRAKGLCPHCGKARHEGSGANDGRCQNQGGRKWLY
jgi:hypothetical protein